LITHCTSPVNAAARIHWLLSTKLGRENDRFPSAAIAWRRSRCSRRFWWTWL